MLGRLKIIEKPGVGGRFQLRHAGCAVERVDGFSDLQFSGGDELLPVD